jgi:hypothetical protein
LGPTHLTGRLAAAVGALVGLAMLAIGELIPPAVRFTAADPDAL